MGDVIFGKEFSFRAVGRDGRSREISVVRVDEDFCALTDGFFFIHKISRVEFFKSKFGCLHFYDGDYLVFSVDCLSRYKNKELVEFING